MSNILKQEEINHLLTAISSTSEATTYINKKNNNLRIYDIQKPIFLSKKELKFFNNITETIARRTSDLLCKELRINSQIHTANFDFLTCEEFIRSIPTPTFLTSFTWFDENGLLEIDPDLLYEGLLKQKEKTYKDPNGLEIKIIRDYFIKPIFKIISTIFKEVLNCENRIKNINIYSNPQFTDIISHDELGIAVTLEAKIGESKGFMNFFIPKKLVKKLFISEPMNNVIPLTFTNQNLLLEMGRCNLSGLEYLEPGTIIELNKTYSPDITFDVLKNDKKVGEAEILIIDENFCIRLCKTPKLNNEYNSNFNTRVIVASQYISEEQSFESGIIVEMLENCQTLFRVEKNGTLIAYGEPVVINQHLGLRIVSSIK